jgi:hypothetical protein
MLIEVQNHEVSDPRSVGAGTTVMPQRTTAARLTKLKTSKGFLNKT